MFGDPPLPQTHFRPHQWEAICALYEGFQTYKPMILQAPTGAGKSFIAEVVRRLLGGTGVYACTTRALQDQYLASFPYARILKGRSNYLTDSGILDINGNYDPSLPYSFVTCRDCTYTYETGKCRWCPVFSLCNFQVAKRRANLADLAVTNIAYLLHDLRLREKATFFNRGLTTIDEADVLEDVILSNVELELMPSRRKQLRIGVPLKKTVPEAWLEWVQNEALPKVEERLGQFPQASDIHDIRTVKEFKQIGNLHDKLLDLKDGLQHGRWVYDGYNDDDPDNAKVIFRPVYVGNFGRRLLFDPSDRVLTMSATILSPDMFADDVGLGQEFGFVDMPSTFPPENRPIYPVPIANMVFKEKRTAWPRMAKAVAGILRLHPEERILVHTVSFSLADYLRVELAREGFRRPIITYSDSRNKELALNQYKAHPHAVMLAASMDRGIDLPDDLCTVQVVAKVPYPNTSDKRIGARMYGHNGKAWYTAQTIRTIIQMTGRGVRGPEDKAVTYIPDAQFANNLWKNQHLFPRWWKEAVNWRFPKSRIMGGS